ncbi:MAG: hypothetical protein UIC64_04530 [Agathobacter sp.]|nr:hypothetical protein [Agathobacter sp.]
MINKTGKEKTRIVYGDSDTLSSFLNRNSFEIFLKPFEIEGFEIVIPQVVYDEVCRGPHKVERKNQIDAVKRMNRVVVEDIESGTEAADIYFSLCEKMGKGEAAALAMAESSEGKAVVASNNMSDVKTYAASHGIQLWPTAKILQKAIRHNVITENRADVLWEKMKEDGMKLPDEWRKE